MITAFHGFGADAPPPCPCQAAPTPWWMVAVAAVVGVAAGYVVKGQMDKKKEPS